MANNSNVSKMEYGNTSTSYSFLPDNNANIDANYGPWISTDAYEAWLLRTDIAGAGATPIEGTLIAIQPTEHADVTLYVYTSNVGDGTWKPIGSGGTGVDDIGYVTDNVEVQLLNKQVVSTSANQGLDTPLKVNARNNIGAASADDLNNNYYKKSETYTKSEIDDSISQIQAASGGDLSGYYNKVLVNDKLDLKADKANTVTTNTNLTTDENGPITGDKSFTGNVDFSKKTWISEVILQGNTVFKGKDQLLNDNTVIIESGVKFPNLDPGILTIDNSGEHKVVTVPASSFTPSSSTYITPDWNNNTEGTSGYIANKPNLNDYLTKSGGLITGTLSVSGKISGSGGIEILGNTAINGDTNIGTSTNQKDLTVSKDATVENNFVAKGNVSLGTGVSDIAKTITLGSTTGAGNVADNININGIITSDVTIGKATSAADNKNLTVNGDVATGRTFTQTLQVHNNTTLGTATTQSQTSDSSTVINGSLTLADLTANSILKLDGNKKVVSDTDDYTRWRGEVETYDNLPGSNGVSVGDIYFIRSTGTQVIVKELEVNNNIYVKYPKANVTIVIDTDPEGDTPILDETDFFTAFGNDALDEYPEFSHNYHGIYYNNTNIDLKIVPVRSTEYGIILILCNTSAGKAWAVTSTNTGDYNTWYITSEIHNGSGVVEVDIIHSTIPSNRDIYQLQVFGAGVVWKPITVGNSNTSNTVFITENSDYDEIQEILFKDKTPCLCSFDNNCQIGNYYYFVGGYEDSGTNYYVFASIVYDSGFKISIKKCNNDTDSVWTTEETSALSLT